MWLVLVVVDGGGGWWWWCGLLVVAVANRSTPVAILEQTMEALSRKMVRVLRTRKLRCADAEGWVPQLALSRFLHLPEAAIESAIASSIRADGMPYFQQSLWQGILFVNAIEARRALLLQTPRGGEAAPPSPTSLATSEDEEQDEDSWGSWAGQAASVSPTSCSVPSCLHLTAECPAEVEPLPAAAACPAEVELLPPAAVCPAEVELGDTL